VDDGLAIQIALHEVVRGRLRWHFLLEQRGRVLVEGFTLESAISASYGEIGLSALKALAGQFPCLAAYA
jgi:hypothetical protein